MKETNIGATKTRIGKDTNALLIDFLGDQFGKYRDVWNKAGPDAIPEFPIHIDFELVDRCNMSCVFCPRNEENHPNIPYSINTGDQLDEEDLDKIIAHTSAYGLQSINFAWGEPLLYKNIFTVIKKFHNSGVIDSRLVTNGLLLHKFMDQIFDSGLINLYVSLDALSEETYSIHRGKGYHKVKENLLNFLAEKKRRKSFLPISRVSFVETKENTHEMEAFKKFWMDKVDFIDIQIYADFNKSEAFNSGVKKWNCIEPFRRVSLMGNGDIVPCCSFHGKNLVIGNISKMTIKEAWDSEKMQVVRARLLNGKEPICLACQSC